MTDNQINTLNMANTTTAYIDSKVSIFTTNTKVTTQLAAVKATIVLINQQPLHYSFRLLTIYNISTSKMFSLADFFSIGIDNLIFKSLSLADKYCFI